MNKDHSQREELRDSMMDSLLQSAFETGTTGNETRIESVMERIDREQPTRATVPASRNRQQSPRRWKQWMSWAVAASVLITLIVVVQTTGSSGVAMAAVERSLAVAKEFVARQYRVTVSLRSPDQKTADIESDLYVQGSDRFALRHPALLPGTSFWLGTDGKEAWLVPAIGPVRVGDETGLGRWFSQRESLSTPYLHVETILARMKRGYQLQELPDESIEVPGGKPIVCKHVVGTLRWNRAEKAPDKIELWSDSQTGVAIRLDATWNEPSGALGHEKISLVLVDEPELSNDWFTATGHSPPNRRILRFDSTD